MPRPRLHLHYSCPYAYAGAYAYAHVLAPLVRYGLEWRLTVHRPSEALRPAALVEAVWDGKALCERTKGAWGRVRHHPIALAYGSVLRLGWEWRAPSQALPKRCRGTARRNCVPYRRERS